MRVVVTSLIALSAVAWLVVVIASPALPSSLATMVYIIGSQICHQRADRSFHLFGAQLAVCARCSGIYAGAAMAGAAALGGWRSALTSKSARWLLVVGAVPTIATLAAEWSGVWPGSNVGRAAAGLPLGFAVGLVVMQAVATVHYGGCVPRPPIASNRPSTPT